MKSWQHSWLGSGMLLLALALTSGCGSSESKTVPATPTIFYSHSAFVNNSTAMTMGYNAFGQLGNGTLESPMAIALPVVSAGKVGGVAAGGVHTVAFGNHSTVYTWGSNYKGQLGFSVSVGTTSGYAEFPVPVKMDGPVTAVAAGGYHTLALVGDKVYTWGYNASGQLGTATFGDAIPFPKAVVTDATGKTPLSGVTKIAAGGSHSLAATSENKVYAWGGNYTGQLGYAGAFSTHAQVAFFDTNTVSIDAIGTGGSSSYVLESRADGVQHLWGWGYNAFGQLGSKNVGGYVTSPQEILPLPDEATTSPVVKIAAGGNHLLILLGNGHVYGIGFNNYGQTGSGALPSVSVTKFQQVKYSDGTPLVAAEIVAIGNHSLARVDKVNQAGKVDKRWYGWGDNGSGQLGNVIQTTTVGYILTPTLVLGAY